MRRLKDTLERRFQELNEELLDLRADEINNFDDDLPMTSLELSGSGQLDGLPYIKWLEAMVFAMTEERDALRARLACVVVTH